MKSLVWRNDIRLHKYLSACGIASRRKSEEYIKDGRIKVNGKIIREMGYVISLDDKVEVDNKIIRPEEKVYIVLNKPAGYLCTNEDEHNRKTIYDLLKNEDAKLFSLGRLDKNTSGLIILTNDGDFANSIIHPSNNVVKEYFVETYKKIPEELKDNFIKGIKINNVYYKAEDIINAERQNVLKILLKEGKKREIREVFNHFSCEIKTLRRLAIGGLRLENLKLKEGEYRHFKKDEMFFFIKKGGKR